MLGKHQGQIFKLYKQIAPNTLNSSASLWSLFKIKKPSVSLNTDLLKNTSATHKVASS